MKTVTKLDITCRYLYFRICPSVILYLLSVCPAIWLIELNKLDKRLLKKQAETNQLDKQLKQISGIEEHNTTMASTIATSPATTMVQSLSTIHNTLGVMNISSGFKNNSVMATSDILADSGVIITDNISANIETSEKIYYKIITIISTR